MDFQVEATIHLDYFQNETEVFQILRSHDFELSRLSRNELRAKGWFLGLRSVKARLEQLLEAQSQTDGHSSHHYPDSSKAVPKNLYGSTSAAGASRNTAPDASQSSPSTSASLVSGSPHHHPTSCHARPDQRGSARCGHASLLIERDVFRYAERFRGKELCDITKRHNVRLIASEVDGSVQITLEGRRAREAADVLQTLLIHLHKSLRTQEVPRMDIGPKGDAVLQRIRDNRHIYYSVLVCEMNDRLHLIGPSAESYELKQRLLERSGRTGRTRGSRTRSSSVPAARPRPGDGGRAAGGSLPKVKDEKREDAEPAPARTGTRPATERSGAAMGTESKWPLKPMFSWFRK